MRYSAELNWHLFWLVIHSHRANRSIEYYSRHPYLHVKSFFSDKSHSVLTCSKCDSRRWSIVLPWLNVAATVEHLSMRYAPQCDWPQLRGCCVRRGYYGCSCRHGLRVALLTYGNEMDCYNHFVTMVDHSIAPWSTTVASSHRPVASTAQLTQVIPRTFLPKFLKSCKCVLQMCFSLYVTLTLEWLFYSF